MSGVGGSKRGEYEGTDGSIVGKKIHRDCPACMGGSTPCAPRGRVVRFDLRKS